MLQSTNKNYLNFKNSMNDSSGRFSNYSILREDAWVIYFALIMGMASHSDWLVMILIDK